MGAMLHWQIEKSIAVLSENEDGWRKELAIVKFGNYPAELNIRPWNRDHTRMGRGIRLTDEEARKLVDALTSYLQQKQGIRE